MMLFNGQPVAGFLDDVSACPDNPPPPQGYHVWKGPVPKQLTTWAIRIRDHISKYQLGTVFWSDPDIYPELVAARVDAHQWTYRNGKLITGICIKGVTIYRASPKSLVSSAEYVLDPATAAPDPTLALYDPPIDTTSWAVVAVTGAALAATVGLFAWGLQAAGRAA